MLFTRIRVEEKLLLEAFNRSGAPVTLMDDRDLVLDPQGGHAGLPGLVLPAGVNSHGVPSPWLSHGPSMLCVKESRAHHSRQFFSVMPPSPMPMDAMMSFYKHSIDWDTFRATWTIINP